MKPANIFLISCLLLISAKPARAVVLRGVVTEVRDGQSVVVLSGGRNFVVSLVGVAAPEMDQDFGDASRQHWLIWFSTSRLRSISVNWRLIM
jgi:hypothetical protein